MGMDGLVYLIFLNDEFFCDIPDIPLFRTVCQPIQPFGDQLKVRCPAFPARERLNSLQLTRAVQSDPIVA